MHTSKGSNLSTCSCQLCASNAASMAQGLPSCIMIAYATGLQGPRACARQHMDSRRGQVSHHHKSLPNVQIGQLWHAVLWAEVYGIHVSYGRGASGLELEDRPTVCIHVYFCVYCECVCLCMSECVDVCMRFCDCVMHVNYVKSDCMCVCVHECTCFMVHMHACRPHLCVMQF
jgi:hypothetical protein